MVSRGLLVCGLLFGVTSWGWAADLGKACEASRPRTSAVPSMRAVRASHEDPRLAELLATGISRSDTFRGLVERLDASDVIVYVSFVRSHKLRSYLVHDVVAAGGHRYLRIVISVELTDWEVIPVLAHELQHAWEVAQSTAVQDAEEIEALFARIGYAALKGAQVRETAAALRIQQCVKAELD